MLDEDLITLGYLMKGGEPARALARFQRHAKRVYRRTALGETMEETPVYSGPQDGIAHPDTLVEIARWVEKGFRLPLGYFRFEALEAWGWLRSDAAAAWLAMGARIGELGGTIDGPYGDTRRTLMETPPDGASRFSFHICGRAVDLNQGRTAYHVAKEPQDGRMWWRIYCRTADQSGGQGRRFADVIAYSFWNKKDFALPAGYYLDLTGEIEGGGCFERIAAEQGWEEDSRRSEWWHFQWRPVKQKTFQDECELIGITGEELRKAGYSDADLDHPPG